MPIYEYRCLNCRRVTSYLVRPGEDFKPRCRQCGGEEMQRLFSRFAYHRSEADRLAEFDTSRHYGPEFYKDSRNVGLWVKKRAQELGVDKELGPKLDEIVEKGRTGKILEEYTERLE